MRYLLLTIPCLFACSPTDQGTQKGSVDAFPPVTEISTSSGQNDPIDDTTAAGEMMAEALADKIGASMQAAFDEQAAIMARGGTDEQIAEGREQFDAAEAVAEVELNEAFMVQEATGDRSAFEIVSSLISEAGFTIDATSFEGALASTPKIEIQGLSKIEALERVAAEMGLVPVYPDVFAMGDDLLTIGFTDKPRTTPTTFAGPFLVTISELEEQAPHTSGSISLTARALGMPMAAFKANDSMFETFTIEVVESNHGDDLRARPDVRRLSSPQLTGSMVKMSTDIDLKGLLKGTESIESLTGTMHLKRPSEVTSIDFEDVQPGKQTVGEFEVLLREVGTNTALRVRTEEGSEILVLWAPSKGDGTPLGILNCNSYSYGDTTDASLNTPDAPSQLSAKLIRSELLEIPFELSGIQFTRAAEQPEALTALEFDHAQPVSVVFVEFKRQDGQVPEVSLRTVSHANKDAKSVSIKMIYMDDDNKEIKNCFTSMNPAPTFSTDAPIPFIAAKGIETTIQTAFFMPEETVSVQISVQEVEFMDGTTWKAEM